MNERNGFIFRLLTTHLFLPVAFCITAHFVSNDAYLLFSTAQSVLLIVYLTGYWEFLGVKFKNLFCPAVELCLIFIFFNKLSLSVNSEPGVVLIIVLGFIQIYLLIELIKILIVIFKKERCSVEIEFFFKNGNYLITDGGNSKTSRLMNYHFYSKIHKVNNTNNSMVFATDIVKLKNTKSNFFAQENENYPIWSEKVYSPIDGIIYKVVNDIPDNKPFAGNYPYNTGNNIVIKKDNYYFLLGHLKQGSICVKEGEAIQKNKSIAEAGNSGFSERPHIHVQLIESETENFWKGKGISILYRSKNLFKNRLIEIN